MQPPWQLLGPQRGPDPACPEPARNRPGNALRPIRAHDTMIPGRVPMGPVSRCSTHTTRYQAIARRATVTGDPAMPSARPLTTYPWEAYAALFHHVARTGAEVRLVAPGGPKASLGLRGELYAFRRAAERDPIRAAEYGIDVAALGVVSIRAEPGWVVVGHRRGQAAGRLVAEALARLGVAPLEGPPTADPDPETTPAAAAAPPGPVLAGAAEAIRKAQALLGEAPSRPGPGEPPSRAPETEPRT